MCFDKPKIVVSKCLGFDACRYNGQTISDRFVKNLEKYVEYKTICPEVEIGLGVPRNPIRLVSEKNEILLYEPSTSSEYTENMKEFSSTFLDSLEEVDGFILKGRSPSCGIKDVKVYLGKEKAVGSTKGIGIFAKEVLERFPGLAIEEEGRLTNFRIREHFLTKVYLMFNLRKIIFTGSMSELVKFQSYNKYLFMAYHQREQKLLGRIVANHDKRKFQDVIEDYKKHLGFLLARPARYTNYINALMHIFGYFSENLSPKEKEFVLGTLEKYREAKVPLSVPLNLIRSYVIKYQQEYLLDQSIWAPYPEELIDISDSGKVENI